jgi:5'-nucleotidase
MRGRGLARRLAGLVAVVLLAACARLLGDGGPTRLITIVVVSDWHGQLEPVSVTVDGAPRRVGGAAVLAVYFDRERRRNPGGTIVVTAGDAFGATPPLASFLEDVPAVEAQNAMGFDIDTLGNHNFDHGLERLRKLISLARFPYVAANIVGPDGRTIATPTHVFTLNGLRVAVIGVGNPETPALVAPGRTGDYRFLDPIPLINAHAERLRGEGAHIVVVLAHLGATGVGLDGAPRGPLAEVARAISGVDVLIGDHSDVSVNAVVEGVLVVENRSKGAEYAVIDLVYDPERRAVVKKSATQKHPWADRIVPDARLEAMIEGYRAQVRPLFDRKVGEAAAVLGRARARESPLGNFETDVLRAAYGTQLAFDVSGAQRDDLPSGYQPADRRLRRPTPGYVVGPPYDLVRGDFFAVFPFDNLAVTFRISGRALWAALENGLSHGLVVDGRFTNAAGRFLQVSGFTYRFDPRRPPGRRVVTVRLLDGRPIRPDETEYTAVTSDFVYRGGDGYTMIDNGSGTTRELIAETVGRVVQERGTVKARIEGRIGEGSGE